MEKTQQKVAKQTQRWWLPIVLVILYIASSFLIGVMFPSIKTGCGINQISPDSNCTPVIHQTTEYVLLQVLLPFIFLPSVLKSILDGLRHEPKSFFMVGLGSGASLFIVWRLIAAIMQAVGRFNVS
ncbi:MAG: hypothetical protein WCI47_01575 [bacterium]